MLGHTITQMSSEPWGVWSLTWESCHKEENTKLDQKKNSFAVLRLKSKLFENSLLA